MGRRQVKNYAGARGRLTISQLLWLGDAFAVQAKHDGAYCHVHLDKWGRVSRITSRTGALYGENIVGELLGHFIGYPFAVLAGELTAHTEQGRAEAEAIGYKRVHLFDMVAGYEARPMDEYAYSLRRDELFRMVAKVENYAGAPSWYTSKDGIRDQQTHKFTSKPVTALDRFPIVEQVPPKLASPLWDRVKAGELEGLVAVSLRAKLGRPGSKRKCKNTRSLDAFVVGVDSRTVLCWHHLAGHFTCNRGRRAIMEGQIVEVRYDGFYREGTPRFARISRVRTDLALPEAA